MLKPLKNMEAFWLKAANTLNENRVAHQKYRKSH